jgi:hypothetical protein
MRRTRPALLVLTVAALAAACGSGSPSATPTTHVTSTTAPGTTTTTAPRTTTTTPSAPLTVLVAASPSVTTIGTPVTFTVTIRGPGVLSGEDVRFGDGGTTGANAGTVACGQTARADATRTYTHAYTASGTFRFTDAVSVIGPPSACTPGTVTGSATVTIAAAVADNTANGAFLSPTRNLGCQIAQNPSSQVRCVSFSPPQLVTMTADGTRTQCTGNTCDLGNPAAETPVLPYGAAIGNSAFLCLSATTGITCTIPSGRGFTISRTGIRNVGG